MRKYLSLFVAALFCTSLFATDYYLKNNWNGGEWSWKKMADAGEGKYKLENVVFGGTGVNFNSSESDDGATWVPVASIKGDAVSDLDTVTFVLDPTAGTVTATLLGKYQVPANAKYYLKNNWDGGEWTWKEMTKDGTVHKLANVVFGGTGVNFNTIASGDGTWVPVADFLGDKIGALDTVTLTLDPSAGKITAQLLGKYQAAAGTKYYLVGTFNDWKTDVIDDKYLFTASTETPGEYSLSITLAVNDGLKVVGKAGAVVTWYPDGMDNEYKVDADHAGAKTIYFRPAGNSEWSQLSGYIFIAANEGGGGGTPDPGQGDYYLKSNWGGSTEWTWKAMADAGEGKYKLENVVFGGSGVNYNTKADEDGAEWIAVDAFLGDKIGALDTVTLVLAPSASPVTVTATLLGKYVPTGDVKYYIKNNWDKAGDQWEWKEMTKDGEKYKIEKVIFGGLGVNYNTVAADAGATWVAVADFLGDKIVEKDSVTLVLDPKAGTITATLLASGGGGETPDPQFDGKFYITGESLVGSWEPNALACENSEHTFTALAAGDYMFKITVDGTWTTAKGFSDLASRPKGVTEGDNNNICFTLAAAGNVTVKFNGSKITLEGTFDESKEITFADGYYLIGQNGWSMAALNANLKFEANAGNEGEYKLEATLVVDQEIKVVLVENSTIKTWFPDGMDNAYKVDAAHAGAKTVYFRPAGNAEWETFSEGGFIFIEENSQAIDNTADGVKAVKVLRDGQLMIIKGEKTYNVVGAQVK